MKRMLFEAGKSRDLYVILNLKKPLKGRLYIDTQSEDARTRILNIGSTFYQGMALDAGRYHFEVSAYSYEAQKIWVSLAAEQDKTLDVDLTSVAAYPSGPSKVKKMTNSLGMTFVYIEPRAFMMGSPSDEPGWHNYETQHRVNLTKGF